MTIGWASVSDKPHLRTGVRTGGGSRMWEHILFEALPSIEDAVPAGSRVLEIGYGDGELSCWLVDRLNWQIVGLDVNAAAQETARRNAKRYGLQSRLNFLLCTPDETRRHAGQYDAVFIKTVLYSSRSLVEYAEWLDWIVSVLRPGGAFINFETGRSGALVQMYRRLRRRPYVDLCLYTTDVERLYDQRFDVVFRRHYGGVSQFLAPVGGLYELGAAVERMISPRNADNCFAVATVARTE